MTSLKTSIKTITYLSDIGCLEIQGASLRTGTGINLITGEPIYPEDIDPEEELAMLLAFSRKTLVRMNVSDSFQSDSYVNQLIIQARKIGEINNQDVWFNIHGFYFCWNVSTKFFLVCCLTGRQNLSLFI